ncbi:hypothetical protein PAL_GLEAN10004696 [Pteropus alecto]|uniref:Uncharacterized protein n=1 Tax=Pteropus alecto TaxID=9402 RepID=L5L0R9_PTEAL|nr:hypothetical protein PAL_GLEAN10004696 [Pteropus alecto]
MQVLVSAPLQHVILTPDSRTRGTSVALYDSEFVSVFGRTVVVNRASLVVVFLPVQTQLAFSGPRVQS